jgi:hypothetical protein
MVAPDVWFGLDPIIWSHLLNVASAILGVACVAVLAWRIRPSAGVLAAASFIALPLIFGLSRRIGLDVPAAALALAFLVLGLYAIERRSFALGMATGAVFGIAFLVKEVVIPFAPVPLLVGIRRGVPAATLARSTAGMLLGAAITTSWWWWLFATETGRIYRLGLPGWMLVPLAFVALGAVVVGLAWESLTSRMPAWPWLHADRRPTRRQLSWSLGAAWVVAQLVFYSRTGELHSFGLFDLDQIRLHLDTYGRDLIPVAIVGGVGMVFLGVARWRGARISDQPGAIDDPALAAISGVPFALLVIGVGEQPRHYIAVVGIVLAIGAAGWGWFLESVAERAATRSGVRGSGRGIARRAAVVAVGLAVGLSSATVVGVRSGRADLDEAKDAAVSTVTDWLLDYVPEGSTVAFGTPLSFETAAGLRGRYRTVQVRERHDAVIDPRAPLGVRLPGGAGVRDWLALSTGTHNPNVLYAYRSTEMLDELRDAGAVAWVHFSEKADGEPLAIVDALKPDHGFDLAFNQSFRSGAVHIEVWIFTVHPERVGVDGSLYVTEPALAKLVAALQKAGAAAAPTARTLVAKIVVVPSDAPGASEELDRLRAIGSSG